MTTKKAEEVKFLLQDIEQVKFQLKDLKNHSFGFGTSFHDIDSYLRPLAEFYLENKLEKLLSQLKDF